MLNTIRRNLNFTNQGLVFFYGVVIAYFSYESPFFLRTDNLRNILSGHSHIAIMAIGASFPIITGGVDLSVGAIMALVGMVTLDTILLLELPGWVAILFGLSAGALAGLINGLLVTKLKLQPFIATLSTMVAYRGLTYAISGRQIDPTLSTVAITDDLYLSIDSAWGEIPYAFFYLLLVLLATTFLLKFTKFGINLYSVGGNETAAHLAGINVDRIKVLAYVMSGLCTAIATLILTSRMSTSTENLGLALELSAIAAAVIGGVSLKGGVGNTFGPALGAFLIGTIFIGLTLTSVTTYAKPVIIGVVLMIAVSYDRFVTIRRDRKWLKRQQLRTELAAPKTV
jgi:ribose/xylose/arabinose/galactoside ABC-type transport system permease subunit